MAATAACACSTRREIHVAVSQSLIVKSFDAEAIEVPSGLYATCLTALVCPLSTCRGR